MNVYVLSSLSPSTETADEGIVILSIFDNASCCPLITTEVWLRLVPVTTQSCEGVPLVFTTTGTVFVLAISTITSAVSDDISSSSFVIIFPSESYILMSDCVLTVPFAPDTSTLTPTEATPSTKDVGPVTLIYVGDVVVDATAYPLAGVPVVLTFTAYVFVSLFSMLNLRADVLGTASTLLSTCPSLTT